MLTVAQLIAVTLIVGAAAAFFNIAYQVLLPGVVDEADLAEGQPGTHRCRKLALGALQGLGAAGAFPALVVSVLLAVRTDLVRPGGHAR